MEIINHSYEIALPLAKSSGLPGQAGRRIELVFRNTESDPAIAARELKAMVSSGQGIFAVIGCYHSSVTDLASEQVEMQQIPFLNPEFTSPLLGQRGLKWFFRTTPDDEIFSRDFSEFLNDTRAKGIFSLSMPLALEYEDGLWGTSVAQAQQRLAWQQGIPYCPGIRQRLPLGSCSAHCLFGHGFRIRQPQVLNLKDALPGKLRMLGRLIGEDIDLVWIAGHGLWSIRIDPTQIDQILADPAVNARNAISGVGKVTIQTLNRIVGSAGCADQLECVPGEYVLLMVTDTGCGMNSETLAHIF